MITFLLCALAAAVLLQPTAARLYCAAVFVGMTAAHDVLMSQLDGWSYYGSAAVFDLVVIKAISRTNDVPSMALKLQGVCLVSILTNAAGWVLWAMYFPPVVYEVAFVGIFAASVWILLEKERADVGCIVYAGGSSCFRFDSCSRVVYSTQHEGKI